MGAYTAFLDLSLGLASPALGLVASRANLGAVFLVSTLVVLWAAFVAVRLLTGISRAQVGNALGVPTSVGLRNRRPFRPKPGSRLSVVLTVGGPLVYERRSNQSA
jgi:hypothetical protein